MFFFYFLGEPRNNVTARAQLPAGVRCSRCTLRWTYRTSYPAWGSMLPSFIHPNIKLLLCILEMNGLMKYFDV
jgi:hypothetical protein